MAESEVDLEAAHRHFSTWCFNRAWELLEKEERSPGEDEELVRTSLASLWRWTQRADCAARNRAVGCWQVSRAFAVVGQADNARRYAERCLERSAREGPFYLGYAHEALARAAAVAGNSEKKEHHLSLGRQFASRVEDDSDRSALIADLDAIA